jgi:flagellar motor protein MotB
VEGDKSKVMASRSSDWVHPVALAYFNDFETALNDEGRRSIADITDTLRGQNWIIEVRGHASAVETSGNRERGMQIGNERALAVARELVRDGLQWDQLRVVACSDNERAIPRASGPEGHRSNQRVEIVVTQETVAPDPYKSPAIDDYDAERN